MSKVATPPKAQKVFDDKISNRKIFGIDRMPYLDKLSFKPLLKYWERQLNSPVPGQATIAQLIQDRLQSAPELLDPIEDDLVIKKNQELIGLLMTAIFPSAEGPCSYGRVTRPLDAKSLYRTPAFDKLLKEHEGYDFEVDRPFEIAKAGVIYKVACLILKKFYGYTVKQPDFPFIVTVQLPEYGLYRHFKGTVNLDFLDVILKGDLPEIQAEEIKQQLSNPLNWEKWLEMLPPDCFEFHGVVVEYFTDITTEQSLSRIKNVLLEPDVVVSASKIANLERLLQSYFSSPHLKLGLFALDSDRGVDLATKYHIHHPLLGVKIADYFDIPNTLYQEVVRDHQSLLVEDLASVEDPSEVEAALLNRGIRSIILIPLMDKNEDLIGMLELGSPLAYTLNQLARFELESICPLFSLAIQRKREETDNLIEAIIREQYTTLHPSVEWRFVENAFDLMEQRQQSMLKPKAKSIIFEKVYPLYAQADIIGSSSIRNSAIRADLRYNIQLLQKVIQGSHRLLQFPILEQYAFKLNALARQLEKGMTSSEESCTMDFLHQEIRPMLQQLKKRDREVRELIENYEQELDAELGIIYQHRKAYEESVSMINETISAYLEQEDEKAQQMVPHYFEKYKTDGVEFEMYAGQSLLRNGNFDLMQLQNLRLWQFITVCGITREVEVLKSKLPVSLTTAQMIFAYSEPIDIQFRMDEKRFDVDGAYNVRYEIIKKRIDKAVVDGTKERIRAEGKIAIIYTNDRNRLEYFDYIRFLQAKDLLEREVEELTLGPLQGVEGLKALRVKVKH